MVRKCAYKTLLNRATEGSFGLSATWPKKCRRDSWKDSQVPRLQRFAPLREIERRSAHKRIRLLLHNNVGDSRQTAGWCPNPLHRVSAALFIGSRTVDSLLPCIKGQKVPCDSEGYKHKERESERASELRTAQHPSTATQREHSRGKHPVRVLSLCEPANRRFREA